ncbi:MULTISPECIES: stage V sporulation protein AE [Bacillaceae]|uniref:Stage V sporulation protein AE n=1 Tax=Evansella alkalicola TaxID=745819 RepID=A0ABS6K0Q5_9BACI|nr:MULTISPECIES: stage V sporulation protein AE [Bacillaceae]MBU9724027.1 stage V sporulation protein AE [Bacillus alkalicola]
MNSKKQVILITDGDASAKAAVKYVADKNGYEFIGESGGNPTRIAGDELINIIKTSQKEPVLVLFDDCGYPDEGPGEKALITIVNSPEVEVIGAVAVASQSFSHEWTRVDVSIDRNGVLTEYGVDKDGIKDTEVGRIIGDTVSILDRLPIPLIVGIGDIGKMGGQDSIEKGAPITEKAVELILERSGNIGTS